MGIGVPNVKEIWAWYRLQFGMDVRIFEEAAEAPLMIDYTANKVQSRTATLALSMNGGGGFEIWQFTSRNTEKASFDIRIGDLLLAEDDIQVKEILDGKYISLLVTDDEEVAVKVFKKSNSSGLIVSWSTAKIESVPQIPSPIKSALEKCFIAISFA